MAEARVILDHCKGDFNFELKQSYLAYNSADFLKQPALQLLSNHSKGWGHNLQDLKQPETWTIPRCGGNPVKISH